jgi:hypothetical protein
MNTHDVLTRPAGHLVASTKADVFMDSGVENLNGDVDPLFDGGALQRVIAQTDVSFSNSLIEAWWRAQASLAVPAPARQPRHGQEARRVLRDRAQRADPSWRVRRPDTQRDVLRSRCSRPRRSRRPATRSAKAALAAESSRGLRFLPPRCSSAERAHRRAKVSLAFTENWRQTHLRRSSSRMFNAVAGAATRRSRAPSNHPAQAKSSHFRELGGCTTATRG